MFEFQTFLTPKHWAKSNILATSPYTGSSVLYSDVVIFVTERFSRDEKKVGNKKVILYGEFMNFWLVQIF